MAELVALLRGSGTAADCRRTIDALQKHTADLDLYTSDSRGVGPPLARALAGSRRVCVVRSNVADGAVSDALVSDLLDSVPGVDVVLVEVGAVLGPHWKEDLRAAAYEDSVIATASAIPADMLALRTDARQRFRQEFADSVRGTALGEPLWGCVYIRREALEIAASMRVPASGPSEVVPPAIEHLVVVPGLVHVLAKTVVVASPEGALGTRMTWTPTTRRALAETEAAFEPLRVTVDMRCCAYPLSGTQVHALNLVSALAARGDVSLTTLVPSHPHPSVKPHLDSLPAAITRYPEGQPIRPLPQVFHRPYQLFESHINEIVTSGARLVVTHQDMILDRTPAYFSSPDRWRNYAAATALSLVAADEVVFFSEHARREALADGLVELSKTSVVPPGTDHLSGSSGEANMPSALAGRSTADTFLLFVGNAYIHKNRLFALRVAEELRQSYGWDGATVFVGGRPRDGASLTEEQAFLRDHDELRRRFVALRHVTDGELKWLYRHAALVLFPTLYEGFGLIPFEAAAEGTPCVYSGRSSVGEYLPSEGALLELNDAAKTARELSAVLESDEVGAGIVRAIRGAAKSLTWARAANSYIDIYYRSLTRPVGLSLVFGEDVSIGARSQMASTEAERRVLQLLKRSSALRVAAETVLGLAVAVRRALRSH